MRDTHATGIGSLMGAGLAGYCVGNLRLEGAVAPWEDPAFAYPDALASPLQARAPWPSPQRPGSFCLRLPLVDSLVDLRCRGGAPSACPAD